MKKRGKSKSIKGKPIKGKPIKSKPVKSKSIKSKSSSASVFANQDIVGLLTMLVQKLTSLEEKLDLVLSRLTLQPVAVPQKEFKPDYSSQRHTTSPRPMYKVICADCGRHCEVPFRPSVGRPVYCKECFAIHKNKNRPDSRPQDSRPKGSPPVYLQPSDTPSYLETPKSTETPKPVKKKKKAAKKKKKNKKRQ